ncbi:MAG: VWA domain-containing protein [Candidatus Spechtbacterales bacterium]
MDTWLQMLKSLEFTSPLLLSVGAALLLILVVGMVRRRKNKRDEVKSSAIADIKHIGIKRAKQSTVLVNSAFVLIVLMLASALASPVSELQTSTRETKTQYVRNVIMVIDVSGSMRTNFLGFVAENDVREKTSYEAVIDSAIPFLRDQKNMRVGVIFYSSNFLIWRRPTLELEALADDLSRTNLDRKMGLMEQGQGQLAILSKATVATPALYRSARVFEEISEEKTLESKAVILFTDLQDNKENVTKAIRDLTRYGVKVYVMTSAKDSVIDSWRKSFPGNQLVRFFPINSSDEMEEAYNAVSVLESEPIQINEVTTERNTLSPDIALLLVVFSTVFIVVRERYAREVRGGDKDEK